MQHDDARAERRPGGRHLDAHDAAAEHEQAAGGARGARRLAARPRMGVGEAVDGRQRRCAAGAHDHRVPGPQARARPVVAGDLDLADAGQPPGAPGERDADPVEPAELALVAPARRERVAPPEHGGGVELAGHGLAGALDGARGVERLDRPQQRLARHARPVRALAAHQLGLHHDDAQPTADGVVGDVLPRRPSAEDDHVELRLVERRRRVVRGVQPHLRGLDGRRAHGGSLVVRRRHPGTPHRHGSAVRTAASPVLTTPAAGRTFEAFVLTRADGGGDVAPVGLRAQAARAVRGGQLLPLLPTREDEHDAGPRCQYARRPCSRTARS